MTSFLEFLDGKKALIGTGLLALNTILRTLGAYGADVEIAIASLIFVLTGVGVAATTKVLGSRQRIKE
jgi:hypothetical protein